MLVQYDSLATTAVVAVLSRLIAEWMLHRTLDAAILAREPFVLATLEPTRPRFRSDIMEGLISTRGSRVGGKAKTGKQDK